MLHTLTDYSDTHSLVNRLRNARFRFFSERLRTLGDRPLTLLDVGGYEGFWINRGYQDRPNLAITLLNLEQERTRCANMRSVKGNACDMREFADAQFDVVFSNSVIEHLHSYEGQCAMAREVRRVGRYHFVQTPNRSFPIEPHYLLPCFQFLPTGVQRFILTRTSLTRFKRMRPQDADRVLAEIRLLSEGELRRLFPESLVYKETFLGMTKSFTAYNI